MTESKLTDKKGFFRSVRDGSKQQKNLAVIVAVTMLAILANAVLMLRTGVQTGHWQLFATAAIFLAAEIVLVVSLVMASRDRLKLGVLLGFLGVTSVIVLRTVFLADLGAMSSIIYLAVIIILVGQTLPTSSANRGMVIGVVIAVLNLVLDQVAPWDRPSIASLSTSTPIIAGTVIVILGIITLRQFQEFSLRTKFILAFSITAISVVMVSGYIFYTNLTRKSLQEFRSRVETAVAIAALQQNGDEFASISSGQDPLYEKFRVQNMRIRSTDPQFVFVFTASKDENGLYFVVDAGEPGEEGIAAFGERYDDPSETLAANYDIMTSAVVDPEIYTDSFGSFISGYAPIFSSDGERVGVIGIDIDAGTIVQERGRVFTQTFIIVFFAGLASILLGYFFGNILTNSIEKLASDTTKFAEGDFSVRTDVRSLDEVGKLGQSFNNMADQIQSLVSGLEGRVAARTRDLEIVAEVGTATATILESNRLLQEVVDLTKERFHLYHSHIYLLDEKGENLVLTAGAGEPGRIMVAEGRSIPLDREQSLVARAARERKGVTVNDVTQAPDFLPNPLLPDTRSELAVPMVVGGNVIGVFDIQSEQVGRFTDSDVNIQTTLAAQLATSIQNVRSFEQSKKQAELQSLVNVIGSRIQRTTSIEETLQTAIRELGTAIGASRVKANLAPTRQGDGITASRN
jgi:putative methionine-R-sulfoxide reductase with GAF domain